MNNTRQIGKIVPATGQPSSIINTKNQGIFVLGMHRSGTSACTRVLNLLGCALSDQLLGSGEGNETGHWESAEALSLNDEMLASAGSSYDDWGPINTDWRNSAIRGQMVKRARNIVADHAELGPLFAIKDPRICRLADVWLEAAVAAEVEPLVLLMLRNPDEVAASLEARDLMATGYGELLWLRYVLDAEFFTRGQTRVVCRYDQLIGNWQSVVAKIKSALSVVLPRNTPRVHAEISQFLSHSHRHQVSDPAIVIEDPSYSPWLRQTFQIMQTWSEQGEDAADYAALDEVRCELDRAYSAFAMLLLTPEMTGEAGSASRLRSELQALREENESKTEALRLSAEAAEDVRGAAAQRESELTSQIDAKTNHTQFLQSEIDKLNNEIAALSATDTEAEKRLAKALHDLHEQQLRNAQLAGQLSATQSAIVQRQEELAQFLDQYNQLEQIRIRAELECEKERDLRSQLERRIIAADGKIRALETRLEEASKQVAQDLAEKVRSGQTLHESEDQLTQLSGKPDAQLQNRLTALLQQRDQDLGAAEAARGAAERQLAARFAEIASLTKMLRDTATESDQSKLNAQWLRRVNAVSAGFPRWWMLMPSSWRRKREHARYMRKGLFNAEKYLKLYPDVAANGMDPIRHYILHGMDEDRRNPL
ncbi:hypothetical protein [Erythrobacter sp.]|uniref:hypothetical protein n=1 Tax=Erythrobacter sp. TaxID=1042 RepID=UPI0025F20716|nr:hypothetical protein [Erythrobacter sp.]